jgi:ubiquinone biosynthesis monooxygenase Coq7
LLARGYNEAEVLEVLKRNRDEELQHMDTARAAGAEQAPAYAALTHVIKAGCRAAIWLAKRV